ENHEQPTGPDYRLERSLGTRRVSRWDFGRTSRRDGAAIAAIFPRQVWPFASLLDDFQPLEHRTPASGNRQAGQGSCFYSGFQAAGKSHASIQKVLQGQPAFIA